EAVDLFAELVTAKVSQPEPTTGRVLAEGVHRGWLDREAALDLVVVGLDFARPVVRTMWLTTWTDDLHATDADVVARAGALVPALATGDKRVVEQLAPALIAGVPDMLLPDVVAAALTATTKKALHSVLAALADRPRPVDSVVAVVEPQLTALVASSGRVLARAAAQVLDHWTAPHDHRPAPTPTAGVAVMAP
ncbi:MAG: hypothetical protein FWD11_11675, partial [Micrococcales bacterium]|nr:hypothetical protein [Micrococcales bacterium]